MANYPKPNQKTSVKDISSAASKLGSITNECLSKAHEAQESFQREFDRQKESGYKAFASLARATLRSQGHALDAVMDGPAWVKFDSVTGMRLGLSALASKASFERANAQSDYAKRERISAEKANQLDESVATCKSVRAEALAAKSAHSKACDALPASYEKIYRDLFSSQGLQSNDEAKRSYGKVGFWGNLFGSDHAKRCKAWADLATKNVDLPKLRAERDRTRLEASASESSLAAAERERTALTHWFSELNEARTKASQANQWLDKGSQVDAKEIYSKALQADGRIEPVLVAVSTKMPSARAEARAALRLSLGAQALSLGVVALAAERKEIQKLSDNLKKLGSDMANAARRNGSSKGSVKFDMADLAVKLEQRSGQLSIMAKNGPKSALAKVDAMDWGSASGWNADMAPAQLEKMEKQAVKAFGKDSAPAQALAAQRKSLASGQSSSTSSSHSSSSDDSGMSAIFWYSMLSNDSGHMGSVSVTGSVDSSSSSFDFGSISSAFDTGSSSSSWDAGSSSSSWSSSSCSSSSGSSGPSSSCSSSSSSSCSSGSSCSSCSS